MEIEKAREQVDLREGYWLGIASIVIGIVIGVILFITFLFPGTTSVSYAAIVVGVGSIIATLYLASILIR